MNQIKIIIHNINKLNNMINLLKTLFGTDKDYNQHNLSLKKVKKEKLL